MKNLNGIGNAFASLPQKMIINYYTLGNKKNKHNHPSYVKLQNITFNSLGNSIPFITYLK